MSECKYSLSEAIPKMESWCTYQDRCTYEVEQKLATWNTPIEHQIEIINHLQKNRFLDDNRFVESYISGKFKIKRWGKIKIKHHLIQKRIDKKTIDIALKSIDQDAYFEVMKLLAERKLADRKTKDDYWTIKRRVSAFLASKGYESDLIHEVVSEVVKM